MYFPQSYSGTATASNYFFSSNVWTWQAPFIDHCLRFWLHSTAIPLRICLLYIIDTSPSDIVAINVACWKGPYTANIIYNIFFWCIAISVIHFYFQSPDFRASSFKFYICHTSTTNFANIYSQDRLDRRVLSKRLVYSFRTLVTMPSKLALKRMSVDLRRDLGTGTGPEQGLTPKDCFDVDCTCCLRSPPFWTFEPRAPRLKSCHGNAKCRRRRGYEIARNICCCWWFRVGDEPERPRERDVRKRLRVWWVFYASCTHILNVYSALGTPLWISRTQEKQERRATRQKSTTFCGIATQTGGGSSEKREKDPKPPSNHASGRVIWGIILPLL